MSDSEQDIYRDIFFSHSAAARERAIENGGRFAYYTTAATAHQIVKNQELWMRNAAVMNDFTEVAHGLQCLIWAAAGFKDTLLRWSMKPEVVYGNEKEIQPRVQA